MVAERETQSFTVGEESDRLDRLVAARFPALSRSVVQHLIRQGDLRVNGAQTRPAYRPVPGDIVSILLPAAAAEAPLPEDIPLDVVYEDEHLVVVNKRPGLVVHPSAGHPVGTLVNALLARYPQVARADLDPQRPGIVHRLDRDTSGLLAVALTREAQQVLQAAFKSRAVDKRYLALLDGTLTPERGAIDSPIGRDPKRRQRMCVLREGGRQARTEYRVREYLGAYTYVEAVLLTGRTHQLRVHFGAIDHPVVGDAVYGRRRQRLGVPRQFLHAWRLCFEHPITGQPLELEAPLPDDLAEPLERLRREVRSREGHLPY
ncbi:MAG: RluA family pseudouridine synthase [Chloroflexi bacterium]|nr:RluA family pseudouridine synthase [Chloroflexota bacterium]